MISEMCRNSTRKYWWTVWKDEPPGEVLQTYYEDPVNQPLSITIQFGKESLDPGLYKVQLLVNLTQIDGGDIVDYVYVDFQVHRLYHVLLHKMESL